MPKKKNFLGGMQNYNAQTGEYEPALKGPGGESPSGFKSFKKQEEKDESFDTTNKKRMGIDKKISEWKEQNPEGKVFEGKTAKEIKENAGNDFASEDYVDDFYDRVSDLQKESNTSGIDDDEYDVEMNKLKEELETKKDSMSEDDYNKVKEMLDRFSRPKEEDEIDEEELYEELADNQHFYGNLDNDQVAELLAERKGISLDKAKDYVGKNFNKDFWNEEKPEQPIDYNAKRIGKVKYEPSQEEIDELTKDMEVSYDMKGEGFAQYDRNPFAIVVKHPKHYKTIILGARDKEHAKQLFAEQILKSKRRK